MMAPHAALPPLLALALAGCSGGNPFEQQGDLPQTPDEVVTTLGGRALPPGTQTPSAAGDIERFEARGEGGDGFAENPVYDAQSDTFTIDNLAFDGTGPYSRDTVMRELGAAGRSGPFAVYENSRSVVDPRNGQVITQLPHKLLFQRSRSGATELVIVRTGGYLGFGFGGWAYQRNGGVSLPAELQASFTGDYAGIRDFDTRSGLEFTTGRITLEIDFADFNGGAAQDAIKGRITDRKVFTTQGDDITQDAIDALQPGAAALPTILLDIGPNTISASGEFAGSFQSGYLDANNQLTVYETGVYNGILAGDDPSEAVGITIGTGPDHGSGGTFRETGGFVAVR
ncbi:hypothetical protein [Profundibacterium mesophilum]|uniref:Uncharacterized protein n=1 Tax=Profundibacterium mesophilum KAUST100406-0324 TaxID=1037889 RepID=A0A921NS86_9RHOB|nr:hypothetical protein [Profundibacterium mesophilum]KAF0676985.1 hypothetical protein PMES_00782 [Profundibacterium mesophilum KAUST100406-0324]